MTWIGLKLRRQEIFINLVKGLIDSYDIGTEVNFDKMKLTLR